MANIDRIKLPDNSEYDLQARVVGAVNGNVAVMDGNGNVADGGTKLSDLESGHRNLINNPFFTINERGQSSYSVTGSGIFSFDGWSLQSGSSTTVTAAKNADGSISLDKASGSNYALIKSFITDALASQLVGKNVTFSIKTSGGIFKGTWTVPATNGESPAVVIDNGWAINYVSYFNLGTNENYIRIMSASGTPSPVTIYSVKLEVGSLSTLENDVPPDYALELAKCQTYKTKDSDTYANQGNLVVSNAIAPTEDGATASRAYAVGEHFIRGGKYCVCIAAITSGGTFTLNTNYIETQIGALPSKHIINYMVGNALSSVVADGNGTCTFPIYLPFVTSITKNVTIAVTGQLRVHKAGGSYSDVTLSATGFLQGNILSLVASGLDANAVYGLDSATGGTITITF